MVLLYRRLKTVVEENQAEQKLERLTRLKGSRARNAGPEGSTGFCFQLLQTLEMTEWPAWPDCSELLHIQQTSGASCGHAACRSHVPRLRIVFACAV